MYASLKDLEICCEDFVRPSAIFSTITCFALLECTLTHFIYLGQATSTVQDIG